MGWVASTISSPFGPRCGPIAIEFRGARARILQVASDRRCHVVAAATVGFDLEHPEEAADAILAALRAGGFRGGACVVGLPFCAVRAETSTVADGSDESILREFERTATFRHGFLRPQCGIIRLGDPEAGRVDVAAVTADREIVEAILDPLVDRGLMPDLAEPSFLSVARSCSRAFRRSSDRHRVRLAVDLHPDGATALLLAGDRIVWCRSVDERADVPEAVATCLHDGLPLVDESAKEIRLVGHEANDPALAEELSASCRLPVTTDDVVETLADAMRQIGVRAEPGSAPSAWGGVLGLAFHRPARRQRHTSHQADRGRPNTGHPDTGHQEAA